MTRASAVVALLLAAAVPAAHAQPGAPARDPKDRPPGTSVIRGIVVDTHTGVAVRKAMVNAISTTFESTSALSDGDGRFELRELRAGTYRLSATKLGYSAQPSRRSAPALSVVLGDKQTLDKVVVSITRGGVISGRVVDEYGDPAVGVVVCALEYRYEGGSRQLAEVHTGFGQIRTDDHGAFRLYGLAQGQYFVSASPESLARMMTQRTPAAMGPVTSYYPNAGDPMGAQGVAVAAGKETAGVTIALLSSRLARIRGRAFMANGAPYTSGNVDITYREFNSSTGLSGGIIRPDGTFEISGVAAGTYLLSARELGFDREAGTEIAQTIVTVTGDDLDDVLIAGVQAGVARGRIVSDDGAPLPIRGRQVSLNWTPLSRSGPQRNYPRSEVADDLSFETKGLFGPMRLRAYFAGAETWQLKAALWDGRDIADVAVDLSGRTIEGIEVILTRRRTELRGTLTDERGAPAPDVGLVLFPADERLWLSESRHIRTSQSSAGGEFRFGPVHPYNDYLLAAVPDMEPGQYQDPDFLRGLKERATPIALAEGETKVQNLRLSRTPQ